MAAIYSNGGNRWNILGFNFTKSDALSSAVYKISMVLISWIISPANSPPHRPFLMTVIFLCSAHCSFSKAHLCV